MAVLKYINREISWLSFNERVLQEAEDERVPLIERVRFLGIFSRNLDEFFKVRVASLTRLADLGKKTKAKFDEDPTVVLAEVGDEIRKLQNRRDDIYNDLKEKLKKEGIEIISHLEIPKDFQDEVKDFFYETLRPKLVPIMLDQIPVFPELTDNAIYLLVKLQLDSGQEKFTLIEVPKPIDRFYVIKTSEGSKVLYLDDIIRYKLNKLFKNLKVSSSVAYTIKVTRDAELDFDDDFSEGTLRKMEKSVKKKKTWELREALYDREMPDDMLVYLKSQLKIKGNSNIIPSGKYHNKKDLLSFPTTGNKSLEFKKKTALRHKDFKGVNSLFDVVYKQDVLLHMPYQRFDYITGMLREAAIDPNVKSISITLYRVSKDSNVVNALVNAARNGKAVTVVVELQARFDEENNIYNSDLLKEAGAKVILGVPGLKVHSKIILIQRKKDKQQAHLAYIGTGNFHENNSKIYEDLGVFTANKEVVSDLKKLFSLFENAFQQIKFSALIVSPFDTRSGFSELILNEIYFAQKGKGGYINLKMNSLVDKDMIDLLYQASKAGVKIRLVIRGICCLKPGVKGLSENIEVVSIVGRYLEHSRILEFGNGGSPKVYISSADWMGRNLDRRIEVSTPIFDPVLKDRVQSYFELQWSDNTKSRVLDCDLNDNYRTNSNEAISAQDEVFNILKIEMKG